MNKKLISIIALIIALMLVVLTGCEKEVPKTDGEGTTATTTKVTETTEPVSNNHISMDRVNDAMLNNNINANANADASAPSTDSVTEGSGNTDSGDTGSGNTGAVVEVQDDIAVIKSGVYHIVCKTEMDGQIIPTELAVKGDKIYMFVDSAEGAMGLILTVDKAYLLMPETKIYVELDKSYLASQGLDVDDMLADVQITADDGEAVSEYQETIDGIIYDVKEYGSGRKIYFIGKTMIKTMAPDGSAIYYDDIFADVPDSLFVPPSDYAPYEYEQ